MAEQTDSGLKYETECVATVSEEKKRAAAEFLSNELPKDVKIKIKEMIVASKNRYWFAGLHFTTGMQIRNMLRQNGFSEKEIGIENLDYIYCKLLERAIVGSEINREEENNGV